MSAAGVPPPDRVMRLVVPLLPRADQEACTLVCKMWREIADDEIMRHVRLTMHHVPAHALCDGPRMAMTESLELRQAPTAVRRALTDLPSTFPDARMPALLRLSCRNLRLCASAPPPGVLDSPRVRHLSLVLDIDMHNYAATLTRVHDVVRRCGERLVTLDLRAVQGNNGYCVDLGAECRTLRPPLPGNQRLTMGAYAWPTIAMPCLERLSIGPQFAWLSLHAPRVRHAEVHEALGGGAPRPALETLAAATATLRCLTWWAAHPAAAAPRLAAFEGLEELCVAGCRDPAPIVEHVPPGLRRLRLEEDPVLWPGMASAAWSRLTSLDEFVIETHAFPDLTDVACAIRALGPGVARAVRLVYHDFDVADALWQLVLHEDIEMGGPLTDPVPVKIFEAAFVARVAAKLARDHPDTEVSILRGGGGVV